MGSAFARSSRLRSFAQKRGVRSDCAKGLAARSRSRNEVPQCSIASSRRQTGRLAGPIRDARLHRTGSHNRLDVWRVQCVRPNSNERARVTSSFACAFAFAFAAPPSRPSPIREEEGARIVALAHAGGRFRQSDAYPDYCPRVERRNVRRCSGLGPCVWIAVRCAAVPYPLCCANS